MFAVVVLCLVQLCASSLLNAANFPFKDPKLPWDQRVGDLLKRLTLEEMVDMMALGGGAYRKPNPAIKRLGIQPFNWNTECLRGIVNEPSTSFPQSVGLAASFSMNITEAMAKAVSYEARAFYNDAKKKGDYVIMKGISCLAPFINVVHHPLWGRIQEVYGEDPYLSGKIAEAYVKGLQGNHPRYVTANSGCKVVDVHSGPENIPVSRFSFNAIVSERDLRLTFLPNQKICIEAGTYNLMCSYNSINGTPACANKWLLKEVLRNEFGFKGYYISDEGAIENIYTQHKYVNSSIEAAVAAAKAGVNLELPPNYPIYLQLTEAVKKGMISQEEIAELVRPLIYTRLRLGEFDPPQMNPYNDIDMSVVQSEEHRELAIQAATQTFVLLKNDDNILPLATDFKTLAVIGPMSNTLSQLYGNYQSQIMPQFAKTVFQGLEDVAPVVNLVPGCENNHCLDYVSQSAIVKAAVEGADVIVLSLGTGTEIEQEGSDRATMDLPAGQMNLLEDVSKYAANKPVILLVFSGGPVNIATAKNSPAVKSILQCFFPSQSTGEALRRVLFKGKSNAVVSPAARLPYTWYASLEQAGEITDYNMEGKTYRYYKGPGDPIYPFGYGLSYSKFLYSNLQLNSSTVREGEGLQVTVQVSNVGQYDAEEVVQMYISWKAPLEPMPKLQLVAFQRLLVKQGQTVRVPLQMSASQLMVWVDGKGWQFDSGDTVTIYVGGQQPNQTTNVGSNVLTSAVSLVNSKSRDENVRRNQMPGML